MSTRPVGTACKTKIFVGPIMSSKLPSACGPPRRPYISCIHICPKVPRAHGINMWGLCGPPTSVYFQVLFGRPSAVYIRTAIRQISLITFDFIIFLSIACVWAQCSCQKTRPVSNTCKQRMSSGPIISSKLAFTALARAIHLVYAYIPNGTPRTREEYVRGVWAANV